MVDMARSTEEMQESMMGTMVRPEVNKYPYGLCISLTHDELEKLDLDDECEVGDILHIVAMARVTSVSKNETTSGQNCRIELQIFDIETMENENTEYGDEDGENEKDENRIGYRLRPRHLYK